MIKKFEDYTNGNGFLLPSESSANGIAHAPSGDPPKVNNFKDFNREYKKNGEHRKEGEYRTGSDKFGALVHDIMMFLRLEKDVKRDGLLKDDDESDKSESTLKYTIDEFYKKSHIDVKRIQQYLDSDANLFDFKMIIDDTHITFTNLDDVYKNRFVWGENLTYE
jgi:hypothetical protein